jgi:hypothetical protein
MNLGGIWLFAGLLAALGNPQDADVPQITTQVAYRDGAAVTISYRAVNWDERNGFRPEMATLHSNVQLKIGQVSLDAGEYGLGIVQQNQQWLLWLTQEGLDYAQLPVFLQPRQETAQHLTFQILPGLTDRDFILICLYGNLSTSLRWFLTGVPLHEVELPSAESTPTPVLPRAPLRFTPNAPLQQSETPPFPGAGTIGSATIESATAGPKERRIPAGSGIFRRLYEMQKKTGKSVDHEE